MSNINYLSNNQYYAFAGQQNAANTNDASDSLAKILSNTANNSGDIVDLSPEAQSYLDAVTNGQSSNFTLSSTQLEKLNEILAKYKDAPYTQETFKKIEIDLEAAGLSPDQLAKQEQANAFNPVQTFIDIIAGKQTDITSADDVSAATEQAKSTNYLKQILQHWKNISTANQVANDVTNTANQDNVT